MTITRSITSPNFVVSHNKLENEHLKSIGYDCLKLVITSLCIVIFSRIVNTKPPLSLKARCIFVVACLSLLIFSTIKIFKNLSKVNSDPYSLSFANIKEFSLTVPAATNLGPVIYRDLEKRCYMVRVPNGTDGYFESTFVWTITTGAPQFNFSKNYQAALLNRDVPFITDLNAKPQTGVYFNGSEICYVTGLTCDKNGKLQGQYLPIGDLSVDQVKQLVAVDKILDRTLILQLSKTPQTGFYFDNGKFYFVSKMTINDGLNPSNSFELPSENLEKIVQNFVDPYNANCIRGYPYDFCCQLLTSIIYRMKTGLVWGQEEAIPADLIPGQ